MKVSVVIFVEQHEKRGLTVGESCCHHREDGHQDDKVETCGGHREAASERRGEDRGIVKLEANEVNRESTERA